MGRFLPAGRGNGNFGGGEPDPALVNPDLPISYSAADLAGASMTYWPSYSTIEPAARSAYLRWLSSGKNDPQAYIGYVFLYFYGLERRLLVDRPPPEEATLLVAEINRLRGLYDTNGSFDRYSAALLDAVTLLGLVGEPTLAAQTAPDLLAADTKLPLTLKLRVGRMIKEGQPLPFDLTLAAYMSANRMMMPAERCRAEFVALMRDRFGRKYPNGFKVRPRQGPLQTWYRGANRYLSFDLLEGKISGTIPDPDLMSWERLDEMIAEACEALGPYARLIGRKPELRDSLEAKNLLPPEIKTEAIGSVGGDVRQWLEVEANPLATVPLKDLTKRVLKTQADKVSVKTLRALADVLDEFGYGVEPDPRYTTLRADGDDVALVFKAPNPEDLSKVPREAYRLATVIVALVAGIANASTDGFGPHELRWIEWIDKRLELRPTEAARLRAHLFWLVAKKLSLGQIKKMMGTVPITERESIARFVANVAAADGIVDKAEVAFLEKVYDELQVARTTLYAALHESTAAAMPAGENGAIGYAIPKDATAKTSRLNRPPSTGSGTLDAARIAKVMAETHQVSAILANVFADDSSPSPSAAGQVADGAAELQLDGLDRSHAKLLARLLIRESWTRAEFEATARSIGLLPDGALEVINEWSFDVADDALIEIDGDLKINQTLARELAG